MDIKRRKKYFRVSFVSDKELVKELTTNKFDGTKLGKFKLQSSRLTEILR